MARFRVGDVCVIVRAPRIPSMVGMECTIIGAADEPDQRLGYTKVDWRVTVPAAPPSPNGEYWCCHSDQLRLRRPPSWDSWLFDTRDVDRECKEGQPA